MPHARGVEPMQAGLRDDDRPLGMVAARLSQNVQYRVLDRIRRLHHDQEKVGLSLAPGNVVRGIVVRLPDPSRVEKPEERCLGRHVIEGCRARAGREPLPDLRARITCESGDDGGLARAGLAKEPNHGGDGLGALAGALHVSA